jgi:hypothetical protein
MFKNFFTYQKFFLIIFISFFPEITSITIGQENNNLFEKYSPGISEEKIVAEVGSIKISAEEFFYSYEYGPAFVKKNKDSKKKHLNYMVNEKLLSLEGYLQGIDKTDQVSSYSNEFINDISTEELFKAEILSKIIIEQADIDTAINKMQLELEIQWLYSDSKNEISYYVNELNKGASFDSIFLAQINDTIFIDDRCMKSDRFKLEKKNPLLAKIIDSLKAGEVSLPVHVDNGWYIFRLSNVRENIISTETELTRLTQEAVNALTKSRSDKLSDDYVHQLMVSKKPIIKRNVFNVLRSFLGKYVLAADKFDNWDLKKKMDEALAQLELSENEEHGEAVLIEMQNDEIKLKEFLTWFWNRSQYIKFNKSDLQNFSASLENLVWLMLRDNLLSKKAEEKGYKNSDVVQKQSQWWKDKIVSGAVKNEIANSVLLENEESASGKYAGGSSMEMSDEFSEKLLRKILSLKQQHEIKIYEDVLNEINVSSENDPHAIEFYAVKKGGLIPRTPYPTIDHDWANWE